MVVLWHLGIMAQSLTKLLKLYNARIQESYTNNTAVIHGLILIYVLIIYLLLADVCSNYILTMHRLMIVIYNNHALYTKREDQCHTQTIYKELVLNKGTPRIMSACRL